MQLYDAIPDILPDNWNEEKELRFEILNNDVFDFKKLPQNLHILELGGEFDRPLENMPPTLHTLILGSAFNKKLENLPPTLHTLIFGREFNQKIENMPPTLHSLHFG